MIAQVRPPALVHACDCRLRADGCEFCEAGTHACDCSASGDSCLQCYGSEPGCADERLRRALRDPRLAYYSDRGRYLGQAIPIQLTPQGELVHRCAERLWTVTASLQGDLLSTTSPTLPLFVLKQNSFESQWCEGRGDGESLRQVATTRPSVNLFKGGSGARSDETSGFVWSYLQAWINVKRTDFHREAYAEGASNELAGRGLYGTYLLLFPYEGFFDTGIDVDQIEDVLLRFDYISADNGPKGHFGVN